MYSLTVHVLSTENLFTIVGGGAPFLPILAVTITKILNTARKGKI